MQQDNDDVAILFAYIVDFSTITSIEETKIVSKLD